MPDPIDAIRILYPDHGDYIHFKNEHPLGCSSCAINYLLTRLQAAERVCTAYIVHHGKAGGNMETYKSLQTALTTWDAAR